MAKAALEQKAMSAVPQYLIEQNRPYSPVDIYNNLHAEYSKTLITKALEAAVASGKIKEKAVGKQKIYYANQENFEKSDDSVLTEYETRITELSNVIVKLNNEYKELEKELKTLTADDTTEHLKFSLTVLENRIKMMDERCATLEAGKSEDAEAEAKRMIQQEININQIRNTRKRLAKEIFGQINEGSNMAKKALIESLGIEIEKGEI